MSHLYSWNWSFFIRICVVSVRFQYTARLLLSFFFFSSESVTAQKPQSSTSKTACLSFIGLLALHLSHECHSRFHRTGAGHPVDLGARSQGQEREGALLLNIWWGAAEAFVFPCIFLLGADLTLSISLTCLVTNNNQEKLST